MRTDHIIALISAIRARSVELLETELRARGITDLKVSHGALLSTLYGRGGRAGMKELLRSRSRKKSTLTEMANRLERQGYLRRLPDPEDARGVVLELLPKAYAIKGDFDEISGILLERAWRGFGEEERAELVRLLEKMLATFVEEAGKGGRT